MQFGPIFSPKKKSKNNNARDSNALELYSAVHIKIFTLKKPTAMELFDSIRIETRNFLTTFSGFPLSEVKNMLRALVEVKNYPYYEPGAVYTWFSEVT